jgi:uncharacterized protein YyaL (SSP411 family)
MPPPARSPDSLDSAPHTNRLAGETSPYLLQHSHNPVDWFPWGDEALAKARGEKKPIFLSIGYAACHWCHVMERESFEDETTAAQLNRDFVAIKVDREERPDLDQLYMGAVQQMTGGGGWPMSVFLTPQGKPFYGGTYFPPEPSHGLPSFRDVLTGVRRAWDEQREEVERAGTRLVNAIVDQQRATVAAAAPTEATLEAAVAAIEASFDTRTGGWGGAPKFPQSMTIEFLLRRAASGDQRALAVARRVLDAMADGGIHDQLGGGFHRYATDANWLVPHFEQMLYDNAQLARVYVHAWQLTGDRAYLDVGLRVLDFMARDLQLDGGGFAASLDADTRGVEGATFTWQAAEIGRVLERAGEDPVLFEAAYGVAEAGNWDGRTILSRVLNDAELARRYAIGEPEVAHRLTRARALLFDHRSARPQPGRDDKALAAWNGLAIAAFADAARALEGAPEADDPTLDGFRGELRTTAVDAAEAIVRGLFDGAGRLKRSWKDGRATADGVLEDYACLAEGLLALYEATAEERWFIVASQLADAILERFADAGGGFFDTASDAEVLVARARDLQDNATPSGGSMAVLVLLRLAEFTGQARYRTAAEAALQGVVGFLTRYPTAFAWWLVAADLSIEPGAELAVVGPPGDPVTTRLLRPALRGYRPHLVIAVAADPVASAVPLMADRFAIDGRPTAFLCRNFACRQPVTEPEALAALLSSGEPTTT